MKFHAHVEQSDSGDYIASAEGQPGIFGRGLSPASALDQLRAELRYRLEYCPCTSVGDDFVQFDGL